MTRHLADHENPKQEEIFARAWRAAHPRGLARWEKLWQKAAEPAVSNRALMEFARIDRGREA
jgi:hypothetical protein